MTPLQHLKELIREDQRRRNPDFPERLMPAPNIFQSASPEKRELKRIVKYIELGLNGVANITDSKAKRIDNRTSYIDGLGRYREVGSVEYRRNTGLAS